MMARRGFGGPLFCVLLLVLSARASAGASAAPGKAARTPRISAEWADNHPADSRSSRGGGQTAAPGEHPRQYEQRWSGHNLMQQSMGMTTRPAAQTVWGRSMASFACVLLLLLLSFGTVAASPPPPPHDAGEAEESKKQGWQAAFGLQRWVSLQRKAPNELPLKEDDLPDSAHPLPVARAEEAVMQVSDEASMGGSLLGLQRGMLLRKSTVLDKSGPTQASELDVASKAKSSSSGVEAVASVLGLQRGMTLGKTVIGEEERQEAAAVSAAPLQQSSDSQRNAHSQGANPVPNASLLGLQRGFSVTKKAVVTEEEEDPPATQQAQRPDVQQTQQRNPQAVPLETATVLGLQRGMQLQRKATSVEESDEEDAGGTTVATPQRPAVDDLSLQRETLIRKGLLLDDEDALGEADEQQVSSSSVLGLQRGLQLTRRKTTATTTATPAVVFE